MRRKPPQVTTYEQMPWDQKHVESIYNVLQANIDADGQWHDFPPLPQCVGKYRVYNNRYFQVVYAKSENKLLQELLLLPPVNSEDDAEWTIQKLEAGYTISSLFSITPALENAEGYEAIAEWLWRHALVLELHKIGLQGVAYFTDLEPGCLLDAMQRLTWLENVVMELNVRLKQTSGEFWNEVRQMSDAVLDNLDRTMDWTEEIIPVPEYYKPAGRKMRQALHSSPQQ